jgi:hypothetical protein
LDLGVAALHAQSLGFEDAPHQTISICCLPRRDSSRKSPGTIGGVARKLLQPCVELIGDRRAQGTEAAATG